MLIKDITFTFENCEQFTIDGKWIGAFLVSDIYKEIRRMGCNWIGEIVTAETFAIEIAAKADEEYFPFGVDKYKTNKFERFKKYHDITNISFSLYDQYGEDNSVDEYDFTLYWGGDNDMTNESMTVYQSEFGNLYIVVSKNGKFDDFFDKEFINDRESMNFHFNICDIGGEHND